LANDSLAYAVGGAVGVTHDHPGLFSVFTSTKSGTTATAIDALYEEIDNIKKVPATAEELERAKESLLNSFIFRVDSRAKVLFEKTTCEFYGYPLDFLERYPAGVEKVTAADVARIAQKYIDKSKLAVLVVGKATDFDRPLSSFGPVTTIDITIPPPVQNRKAGTSP
jgi:zinc protease